MERKDSPLGFKVRGGGKLSQMKKSLIPFLIVVIVALFFIDFGDRETAYEVVSFDQLPERYKEDFHMQGPGGTGMFTHKGHTYAFILTEPDEQVYIEFVGKETPMGAFEVKYTLQPRDMEEDAFVIDGTYGQFVPYILKLEKKVSPPYGFMNTNEVK